MGGRCSSRWIGRELSPTAKARDFAEEALRAIKALARLADTPPAPAPVLVDRQHTWPLLWFMVGAATAGAAFVTGLLLGR